MCDRDSVVLSSSADRLLLLGSEGDVEPVAVTVLPAVCVAEAVCREALSVIVRLSTDVLLGVRGVADAEQDRDVVAVVRDLLNDHEGDADVLTDGVRAAVLLGGDVGVANGVGLTVPNSVHDSVGLSVLLWL